MDGPFAGQVALFYGTRYDPHCLSRGFGNGDKEGEFSGIGVRPEVVENILKQDSYEKFFLDFENGPHSVIPNGVRGDFFSFTAPYGMYLILVLWSLPFLDSHSSQTQYFSFTILNLIDCGGYGRKQILKRG